MCPQRVFKLFPLFGCYGKIMLLRTFVNEVLCEVELLGHLLILTETLPDVVRSSYTVVRPAAVCEVLIPAPSLLRVACLITVLPGHVTGCLWVLHFPDD